jgi:DNA-directed RNA polymerase specialized sigma54-like protein
MTMEALINIEETKRIVDQIEAQKAVVKSALESTIAELEGKKPKPIKRIGIEDTCVRPEIYSTQEYNGRFKVQVCGLKIERMEISGRYSEAGLSEEDLKRLAACIIKAVGMPPQEMLDSVEVEK